MRRWVGGRSRTVRRRGGVLLQSESSVKPDFRFFSGEIGFSPGARGGFRLRILWPIGSSPPVRATSDERLEPWSPGIHAWVVRVSRGASRGSRPAQGPRIQVGCCLDRQNPFPSSERPGWEKRRSKIRTRPSRAQREGPRRDRHGPSWFPLRLKTRPQRRFFFFFFACPGAREPPCSLLFSASSSASL